VNVSSLLASVDGASVDEAFGEVVVTVPDDRWAVALRLARDELGCDWFDFLTAVDDEDSFGLVCHVVRTQPFDHVVLRTSVPHDRPVVDSVAGVYAGAGWHERETAEMFGVSFTDDHGGALPLEPLLLPPAFEGHPLRKDFALQARLDRPWPGAKEPGES
jgi:NADH-quinone oxidoreductase subunit C